MLSTLTLAGYKCFHAPTTIEFAKNGLTTISGKNNSGKSSVFEIFNLLKTSCNLPSRTLLTTDTIQPLNANCLNESPLHLELKFNIGKPSTAFPRLNAFIHSSFSDQHNPNSQLCSTLLNTFNKEDSSITFIFKFAKGTTIIQLEEVKVNEVTLFENIFISDTIRLQWSRSTFGINTGSIYGAMLANFPTNLTEPIEFLAGFLKSIHQVSANRRVPTLIKPTPINTISGQDLESATNLLYNWKEKSKSKYNKVINFLKQVDDSIDEFRFSANNNSELEVLIANHRDQDSTNITLQNSGTGISQLLALSVFLIANENKFVLIDEPQVFLHPHAEFALIDLITSSNNQVVVATHSSIFIHAAKQHLTYLQKKAGATKALAFDKYSMAELADDLGVPANHLLAGRKIFWLEGPTEVEIVRLLQDLDSKFRSQSLGVNYIALPNTGDIQGKKTKRIADAIYYSLNTKLGINSVILLDSEEKTENAKEDLKKVFRCPIEFIDKSEIEEYLLEPKAIHQTIAAILKDLNVDFKEDDAALTKYLAEKTEKASKILSKIFQHWNLEYRKINHGSILAQHCLAENPSCLDQFKNKIISLI